MKVSVAMATYNGEAFIGEQLLSIYNQTRQPDEVIICDDGSTDRTPQIVKSFIEKYGLSNWVFIINPVNLGFIKNFFKAAFISTGDIVFFSDQDDVWEIEKISIMTGIMQNNPDIQTLFCNKSYIDQTGKVLNPKVIKEYKDLSLVNVSQNDKIIKFGVSGMCMAVNRNLFDFIKQNCDYLGIISVYHDRVCVYTACMMNGFFFCNEVLSRHRCHMKNVSGVSLDRSKSRVKKQKALSQGLQTCIFRLNLLKFNHYNDPQKTEEEKRRLESNINILNRRIKNLEENKVLLSFLMVFYLGKEYSLKSYISDILYSLHLERFMNWIAGVV